MSIAAAQGQPNYSKTGSAFIPEVFIKEVNVKYYNESQIPQITNSKFTGDIGKKGDLAYLPQRPDITLFDKTLGTPDPIQFPTSAAITLQVNQLLGYAFVILDANKQQSQIDVGMEGTTDVSMALDGKLQANMYAGLALGKTAAAAYLAALAANRADPGDTPVPLCASTNTGATAGAKSGAYNLGTPTSPITVGPKSMIPFITAFRSVIAEANNNSPMALANVWVVIPEVLRYGLINSDLRKAMEMGDATSMVRTGTVGRLVDTNIFTSGLLYQRTVAGKQVFAVVAGNKDAITFVQQMKTAEKIRYQPEPGDLYRGQVLWDYNVVKDTALVVAWVTYDSAS